MTDIQYAKMRLQQEQNDMAKYQKKLERAIKVNNKEAIKIYQMLVKSAGNGIDFFSREIKTMEGDK